MDKKIQTFIESQKNLTFCTAIDNVPYCANCFYALVNEDNILVFKSDSNSKHIINALQNEKIAGTILPDIYKTGTIKGIQFTGTFLNPKNEMLERSKTKYYKKYPFAKVVPGDFWAIELRAIKMTNNTLGFGKKLIWENPSPKAPNYI